MNIIKRFLLVSAAIVAVFIQGCGCDGKKRVIPELVIPDAPAETIAVSGVANKGIVIGGVVNAHPIVNGVIDQSTILGTATTNSAGGYVVEVDSTATNSPIVVRVTAASSGTQMKCDIPAGCDGGVAFGGLMDLTTDSGFSLDAVISEAVDNTVANITLLTDIATDLAIESIADGATTSELREAIVGANSRIANRFGITGNLTSFPTVDLTDTVAVATATSAGNTAAINYATLNAAIVAAVQQDDATQTVTQAIARFTQSYVTNGLAGNSTDDTVTDLAEIFAAARTVIEAVEAADTEGSVDLGSLQAQITNNQDLAASEPPDVFDQGEVSPTANDTELDKVKAMVAVIRDLEGAIGDSALGGTDNTIGSEADSFDLQLSSAELATSTAVDSLLEALTIATDAIMEAGNAYEDNNELTSYASADGVSVAIGMSGENPSYTIDQTIEFMMDGVSTSADIAIVAVDSFSYTEEVDGATTTYTGAGGYSVSGTIENTDVSLMIADGSTISVTGVSATDTDGESTDSESWSADSIVFTLDVSMMQKATESVSDPITIEAGLSVTFTDIDLSETDMQGEMSSGESTSTLDMASLNISGEASNSSGEAYLFSLSITGETEGITLTETWDSNGETTTHETEQNFAGAYANLTFTANLAGISNAVRVSYGINRTGLEAFSTTVGVAYPGVRLDISTAMVEGEYTGTTSIVNQDGVVATVSETEVDGEMVLTGNIVLDGEEYATITEESAGVIIRYPSDGTFESL